MPNYLIELEDGRKLQVEADSQPTEQDLKAYMASQPEAPKTDRPFFDASDTASGVYDLARGLYPTAKQAFRQGWEGLSNPWQRTEGYKASQAEAQEFQRSVQENQRQAEISGDDSSVGAAFRSAAPSGGFTIGAGAGGFLGAAPAGAAGRAIGTAIGGPAAPGTAAVGEVAGRIVGGFAAGYGAAYRMAGAQFLDDARDAINERALQVMGRPLNEAEQEEAYKELLPIAQKFGHSEAGPEALGNLVTFGAGRFILGLGKKTVEKIAQNAAAKYGLKTLAGVGATTVEVGGETITQVEQKRLDEQMRGLAEGKNPADIAAAQGPRTSEEYQQALEEVGPATLALLGGAGAVGLGYKGIKTALTPATAPQDLNLVTPEEAEAQAEAKVAAEDTREEMSGTRLRRLAQQRQNELTWKRDGKAGDTDTIATSPRALSAEEESELDFLNRSLTEDNAQAIADNYGVKLKAPVDLTPQAKVVADDSEKIIEGLDAEGATETAETLEDQTEEFKDANVVETAPTQQAAPDILGQALLDAGFTPEVATWTDEDFKRAKWEPGMIRQAKAVIAQHTNEVKPATNPTEANDPATPPANPPPATQTGAQTTVEVGSEAARSGEAGGAAQGLAENLPTNDAEASRTKEFTQVEIEAKTKIGEGSESEVYDDGDNVIKVSESYNQAETLAERVKYALRAENLLGNLTGLRYAGFRRGRNGVLNPVFSQRKLDGPSATKEQVQKLFNQYGWTENSDGTFSIATPAGKVTTLSDLYDGGNVIVVGGQVIPRDVATIVEPSEVDTPAPIQPAPEAVVTPDELAKQAAKVGAHVPKVTAPAAGNLQDDIDNFWPQIKRRDRVTPRKTLDALIPRVVATEDRELIENVALDLETHAQSLPKNSGVIGSDELRTALLKHSADLKALIAQPQVSPTAATNENAGTLAGVPASDPVDASKGSILPAAGSNIPETVKPSSGEKPAAKGDLQNSTLQSNPVGDTGVTMTPTIPVHTDDKAASADVRLVLHKATHHYTLWFTRKFKDPSSPKGYRYSRFQYLSILGQDFDAAYQKALQKANEIASGGELPVSFYGGAESAHEAAKSVGLQDKAATKDEMAEISRGPKTPVGEKLVGFGKFSSLTVDQLVEKDIGYADWLVNNGSSKWAREIGEYLRNENPTYIEWREAKNFKESSESDRIRAYEERMKGKKAAPQALPDTTNTTTGNVVKNKKVAKQTSRKAKDQIIDIVKPAEVPNVIPEALSKNMFTSQVDGANATIAAMERNGAALNGDGAGVGKTRQILAVASHYLAQGKTVVIITENAAIGKPWEKTTAGRPPALGGSMAKDGAEMGVSVQLMPDSGPTSSGIYITTYNRVQSAQVPEGAVLIFDESQGLVNIHDRVDPNKKIGQWQQKFGELLPKAEKFAYYSATPADKPHQLSYLYKVLGYETPEAFLEDAVKNGLKIKTTQFGNSEQKKYEIPFGDVQRRKLFKWVNAVMKKAGELGNFIKREISYEGTDTQFHDVAGIDEQKNPWAKQFNEVVEKMQGFAAQGWRLLSPDSYMLYAAELTKIGEAVKMAQRELAAGRKVVMYFSRIQEQEIRGRKILYYEMDGKPVWSAPEVLALIPSPVVLLRGELEKLGIKFAELHSKSGDTSKTAQDKFSKDTNVLLASVESGGTGINLDDLSGKQPRTEIFMFAPYRGISTIQALGRIWRASTVQDDNNPNRYIFVVASDIKQDAMRSAILAKKLQLMDASLGGTAVSRLPMSKVGYDPDQLVGMELPEEGVDTERPEADTTKELKPVKIDFKKSEKGNWWAPATADLLEWLEAGGVERTGLNVSAFKSKDSGKWIALAERQYAPEEFAAPAEKTEAEAPQKPFVPETAAARDAREAGASLTEEDRSAKKAELAAAKEKVRPLAEKGDLTSAEAAEFRRLMSQISSLRFDLQRPLPIDRIESAEKRQSTLPSSIVLTARNDLMRNKDIYLPIEDAAAGAGFNQDTAVDDVMNGKNAAVSPSDLYNAFNDTREALRAHFGDTIKLFRSVGRQKKKATTNWATTKAYAAQFGGNIQSEDIPINRIIAVNVGPSGSYHEMIVVDEAPLAPTSTDTAATPATTPELRAAEDTNVPYAKHLGLPTAPVVVEDAAAMLKAAMLKASESKALINSPLLRSVAKLLSKLDFKGIKLEVIADGRSKYAGSYNSETQTVMLNLRATTRGGLTLPGIVIHEVLHHFTMSKILNPVGAVQKAAVAQLEKIRVKVEQYAKQQGLDKKFDYEIGTVTEFVTHLLTRPDFVEFLDTIPASFTPRPASTKFRSVLSDVARWVAQLVTNRPVGAGSMLEQALEAALVLVEAPQRVGAVDTNAAKKLFDEAISVFGTTQDIREAGYVLPDGTMLDFSGRHQMQDSYRKVGNEWKSRSGERDWQRGSRGVDHREVNQLESMADGIGGTSAMIEFQRAGAMRVDSHGAVDLETAPTTAQVRAIKHIAELNDGELHVDVAAGDRKSSFEGNGTKIIGLIRRFFAGEEMGEHREVFTPNTNQDARFDELTASLPDVMTEEDIAAFKRDEPEKYAELEKMRETVLKAGGWIDDVEHQTNEAFTNFEAGEFGFHVGTGIPSGMLGDTMLLKQRVSNPLRMKDLGVWTPGEVLSQMWRKDIISDEELSDTRAHIEYLEEQLEERLSDERADEALLDFKKAQYEASLPVRELLKEKGYDGIIYKNEAEGNNDSFIALDPEQLKSRDPLAPGPKIPPSQWANPESNDIRYSLTSEDAELPLNDAVEKIAALYADPLDPDNWPDDVAEQYSESPLAQAIDEGDFIKAWDAAPADAKDDDVAADIANLKAAYAAQTKYAAAYNKIWDTPIGRLLSPAERAEVNVAPDPAIAIANLRNQKVAALEVGIDAATKAANDYDIDAAEEWLNSDELVEAAKAPFVAKAKARAKATIKQVEATGRYVWNEGTEEFDAIDDEEVSVRYSKDTTDPIIDGLATSTEQQQAKERLRTIFDELSGVAVKDADGKIVKGVSSRAASQAVASLTKSDQVPNAAATWIGTREEFDEQFAGKLTPPSNAEGFYHNGRPYIITDQITHRVKDQQNAKRNGTTTEVEAVKRLLKHEALVHGGWRSLSRHNRLQILAWARKNVSDDQLAALRAKYPQGTTESDYQWGVRILEEFVANKVQALAEIPRSGPLAELWEMLKRIYRNLTGDYDADPTVKEVKLIAQCLRDSIKWPAPVEARGLKSGGEVRMSYAGESAIDNLPEERRQFMRDSLDTAKVMAANGKTSEEIRAVTGWFPGKYDGKMRFEVPDEGASINKEYLKEFAKGERSSITLGRFLDHAALYEAYPEALDLTVEYDESLKSEGAFQGDTIYFGPNTTRVGSILLHEVQHWIQDKEGFAKGGDSQMAFADPRMGIGSKEGIRGATRILKRILGDMRKPLSIEAFAKQAWQSDVVTPEIEASYKDYLATTKKASSDYNLEKLAQETAAKEWYRNLAGEIEARDVQARQNFTPEQRKAIAPYSSENIAKEDAIVMFGGKGPQASYANPLDAQLAAASQRVREMLTPTPRKVDLQAAYRSAMLGKSSIYVTMDELFDAARKLQPQLTPQQFGQQVQNAYEDGVVAIQTAESPAEALRNLNAYNVSDAAGLPGAYVTVLPTEEVRYSLAPESAQAYARARFKDATAVGEDKDSEQALIRNKGKLLPQHKFQSQTWDNRLHVISNIIDTLVKDHGIKLTDLPLILNSTEDLEGFGIAAQPDMQQIALIVVAEKLQGEANRTSGTASTKFNEAAITALELYQVLREKAGRVLGTGALIHLDERFQHMFVVAQTQKQVRERQKEATDENFGTDVPKDIRDAAKKAQEDEAKRLAEFVKNFEHFEETAREAAIAGFDVALQDKVRQFFKKTDRIAALLAEKAKRGNPVKASFSSEAAAGNFGKLSDSDLDALLAQEQAETNTLAKEIFGEIRKKGTTAVRRKKTAEEKAASAEKRKATQAEKAAARKEVRDAEKAIERATNLYQSILAITDPRTYTDLDQLLGIGEVGMHDEFVDAVAKAVASKAKGLVTPAKQASALNDLKSRLADILGSNLTGEKPETAQETLNEKLIRVFGSGLTNTEDLREAWEAAGPKVVEMLQDLKAEELGIAQAKQAAKDARQRAEDIENSGSDSQKENVLPGLIAAAEQLEATLEAKQKELKANLPASEATKNELMQTQAPSAYNKSKGRAAVREILRGTASFDSTAAILKKPADARRLVVERFQQAARGALDPSAMASAVSHVMETFDAMVADLKTQATSADKAKDAAKRRTDLLQRMREEGFSSDLQDKLEQLLNTVRLEGKVSWDKIFKTSATNQAARKQAMFDAIKADPALAGLTPEQQQQLTDLLEGTWTAAYNKNVKRIIQSKMNQRTHLTPKAKEMFKDALPKFIEAINNGSFTDELVFATLAEKFGVRDMTPADKAKLAKMAQELQGDMPAYERARKGQEMTEFMQKFTHLPMAKILADYWTASVLSGPRTVFAIATAVLNGAFEVLGHSFIQIVKNPLKAENWQIVGKSISEYLKAYPREFYNAWQYVMTGDRSLVSGSVSQYAAFLNDGIGSVSSTGYTLSKSDNPFVARLGRAMYFFEKLLTALDIATSQTTKWGALPLAYAVNTKLYDAALIGTALDRTQARADVLERDFNNVEPTTPHDKARLASWTSQLMEERMRADGAHPDLGIALDDAAQAGRQAAMTLDPSGVGGMFYHAVRSIASTQEKKAAKWLTESREKLAHVRAEGKGEAMLPAQTQLALAYLREFFAHQILGAIGLKFARFGSNKLNQTLSFVPGIGALRAFEEGHNKGLGRQMIARNQMIGLFAAGAAYAILQAIGDDDDELILDGGWESLDRDETSQLMAQGRKRYSFSFMVDGKRHVISYANWPISGVLAAIGLLSDTKRYKPEQWSEKGAVNIFANGMWAAATVTMDAAALSQFAEILGRSSYSRDPVEAGINKFTKIASNWSGGFIPRILKDMDMWQDSQINRYQTGFERFAKEIPIYRRAVGTPMLDIFGKRVSSSRAMWSREYAQGTPEKEYQLLGALNSRGIFLSPANPDNRKVGRAGHKRDMTDSEKNYYITRVGEEYRQFILRYGDRLKHMPRERAEELIYDKTADIRELAAKRAYGKK